MTKKKKQTVWNKRTGKFIPSNVLKPHHPVKPEEDKAPGRKDRRTQRLKVFAKGLSAQIRRAVRNNGPVSEKKNRKES